MLSWFRRPREKYSLENLRYLYEQLLRYPNITPYNTDIVVELLRSIAELMIWGDQNDDTLFYYFCEKNILSHFLRILSQKVDRQVSIQLLQTLSIMIANFGKQTSMYYLLSNNHINDLIVHRFDFSDEEVLAYYISFLKTLSLKLNSSTLQFFFNERLHDFPLYTQAVQFSHHSESMVRIAVRTLTLNVYRVSDPKLRKYILDKSAVPYFCNLVWYLRDQLQNIDQLMTSDSPSTHQQILSELDQQIDSFHYITDILGLNISELSDVLSDQILAHLVIPVLLGSIPTAGIEQQPVISTHLALFVLTQILIVFTDRPLINSIISCLLHDRPPFFVSQLISNAPKLPVFDMIPLTSLLYRSKPSTISSIANRESGASEESEECTQTFESLTRKIPSSVGPVFQPSGISNWKEQSGSNPVRAGFFECLSHPDSRVSFSAASVLMAVLRNAESDSTLLAEVGVCPQRKLKKRRLLEKIFCVDRIPVSSSEVTYRDQSPRSRSVPLCQNLQQAVSSSAESEKLELAPATLSQLSQRISAEQISDQSGSDSKERENGFLQSSHSLEETPSTDDHQNDSGTADPLLASEATEYVGSRRPYPRATSSEYSKLGERLPASSAPSQESTPTSNGHKSRLNELAKCLQSSSDEQDLIYSDFLIERLISILEDHHNRPTHELAIVCQLILELVHLEASASNPIPSCLKKIHLQRLENLLRSVEKEVLSTQAFSECVGAIEDKSASPFGNLFIDLFEHVFLAFPTVKDIIRAMGNPEQVLLLKDTIEKSDIDQGSNYNLESALAQPVISPLSVCIAINFLCQRVRFEAPGIPFVQSPEKMTIRKCDIIDTSGRQLLSCAAVFGSVRERKLLIADEKFLLLADLAPASKEHRNARVFAAIPLHHVEVRVRSSQPNRLSVVVRGPTFIHSACRISKTSDGRPVTFFQLQMANEEEAQMALTLLTQYRASQRKQFLSWVQLFLHSPD